MSIFINTKDQLIDTDFFDRRVKLGPPETLTSKQKTTLYIDAYKFIKTQLLASTRDVSTKELKKLVHKHYFDPINTVNTSPETRGAPTSPLLSKTLESYYEKQLEFLAHRSANLNKAYIQTFEFFLEVRNQTTTIRDINPMFLNEFVKWRYTFRKPNCSRKGEVSDATIKKEVNELKRCIEWAYLNEFIDIIPRVFATKYKLPLKGNVKPIIPLTIEQQLRLLKYTKERSEPHHDLLLFLLVTGIRRGELDTLTQDSFDLKSNTININQMSIGGSLKSGKTESAPRVIPMCRAIEQILKRGHLLAETYLRPLKCVKQVVVYQSPPSERLASFVSRLRKSSEFSYFNIHLLRHTFITNHLQAGEDLLKVSRIVGHKSISITSDRYGKYAQLQNSKVFIKHILSIEKYNFKTP